MARHAGQAELLIELGAGTGAVTRALRDRHPAVPLVAVEAQPFLAEHLRHRFPGIDVRARFADEVLDEMSDEAPERTIVVSSLPFRSLPAPVRDRTVEAVCRFVVAAPDRQLVQFTYQPRPPFALPALSSLRWRCMSLVWRNAPPAGVWVLKP